MKKHRVYDSKFDLFQTICHRDDLKYNVLQKKDDYREISFTPEISSGRFKEILEDIACEEQRSKYKFDRPVISVRTLTMPEKFSRLMKNETQRKGRKQRVFSLLEGDERRIAFYPEA